MRSGSARTLIFAAGLAAAAGLAEAAARVFLADPAAGEAALAGHVRPSPFLPYELSPGVPGVSNSLGLKGPERPLEKPAGVTRIAFVGDSLVYRGGFVERLQKELDAEHPGRFELWNFGLTGYGLQEYAVVMDRKVAPTKPDAVVLSLCMNDLSRAAVVYEGPGGLRGYQSFFGAAPGPVSLWLYRRSRLFRVLTHRRAQKRPKDRGALLLGKELDRIAGRAAALKAPLVVAVFPFLAPPEELTESQRAVFRLMKSLPEERGLPTLDMTPAFSASKWIEWRQSPRDLLHFNEAGGAAAAREIRRFLEQRGLLPRAT